MKGLRLYVRPIEASDHPSLSGFLDGGKSPAWGLLGKLLGELVAVVELEIAEDAIRVRNVFVRPDLRKKRIGRAMMIEAGHLAVKLDRRRIVVDDACDAQEFFQRVGFEREGDRWVRVVA